MAAGEPGRAQASQRVPHERRLAGLARSGDGHDPRRQLVGQETDEVVDEGAFEGVHEMMISARRSIINK